MTIAQEKRWKAEAEIIKSLDHVPSSRELTKLLKEKYGIVANHVTVLNDLKKDLEALTESDYDNKKSGILNMIEDEIDEAHRIATESVDDDLKLKAMNTVSKLTKTKAEILIKFRRAQAQLSKEEKPEYNVYIGQPKKIDEEKFKKLDGAVEDENN